MISREDQEAARLRVVEKRRIRRLNDAAPAMYRVLQKVILFGEDIDSLSIGRDAALAELGRNARDATAGIPDDAMEPPSHTPGRWEADGLTLILRGPNCIIARLASFASRGRLDDVVSKLNACDAMLAALQDLVNAIQPDASPVEDYFDEPLAAARAAIAQVRGAK